MTFCEYTCTSKMTRSALCFLIFIFFFTSLTDGLSKAGSRNSRDNYRGDNSGGSYYGSRQQKQSDVETNQRTASAPAGKSSGGGLGAWGYVAIILTVICTGMGAYYFALFYPILCKKERKYDVMELSSV